VAKVYATKVECEATKPADAPNCPTSRRRAYAGRSRRGRTLSPFRDIDPYTRRGAFPTGTNETGGRRRIPAHGIP
jgi:hypothetical protein